MEAPGNYVVAYEPGPRGQDTVALAVALATTTHAELKFCRVLSEPVAVPEGLRLSLGDYGELLEQRADDDLREVVEGLPAGIQATHHVLWSDSPSDALIAAAQRFGSERIVVGAGRDGLLGRFSIGSVAGALLHASPVSVVLAPRGYRAPEAIRRITVAVGTRSGWQALLDSAIAITDRITVDMRFITLVSLGQHPAAAVAASERGQTQADAHLVDVLAYFRRGAGAETGRVTTEVALGNDIEDAVERIDWRDDEIVLVGSSRLAQTARIFLGVTARRMLRALPVPLIVVPQEGSRTE